jgi:ribosomal protein S12 methylthiotransferase accessory factor
MGRAARELGRLDEAAEHLEQAMRFDPSDTAAIDHLAQVRFEQHRYEDALGLYRRVAERDPERAQIHANLAAALYWLDRVDEAVASYEHALTLDPSLESARAALEQVRPRARQAE